MKATISIMLLCLAAGAGAQQLQHPSIGSKTYSSDSTFSIELIAKKQYYDPTDSVTADNDINSPKSVNMHPDGTRYYVNSLEGATTVVYDFATHKKLKVIRHNFTEADSLLWHNAEPYYPFSHYAKSPLDDSTIQKLNTFYGKPVESTFSHGGRYLWVPYYRRSYDINAQDPSAVAIIDTRKDSIIRLMDTGPLPKMVATSPDGKFVAITHWGDNTVGIINISSDNPSEWRHHSLAIIDEKLSLNFSLTKQVDRDNNSGHCLRGTAFTPDNHYLLVGCMAGSGGIAVVDLQTMKYLGRVTGMMPNLRHLIIRGDNIYLSINRDGYVQRMPLERFLQSIPTLQGSADKVIQIKDWQSVKVGAGARTIDTSPDGRYIYAACNLSSTIYVIDSLSMRVVATIAADSYPVGLETSHDGKYVLVTSQGRSNGGGNCVDIYRTETKQTSLGK